MAGILLHCVSALALCFCVSACGAGSQSPKSASDGAPRGRTLGFVLSGLEFMMPDQCPNGKQYSDRENWEAQFPTRAARQRQLARCGGDFQNRGANCENVWFDPESAKDPLPFREPQTKVAYGINLDGTPDGGGSANSCPHEKFQGLDGEPGVDNQFYRFYGCHTNQIKIATLQVNRRIVENLAAFRLLLEINGVVDGQNDNAVTVDIYRGRDQLVVDATERAVPYQSQRVAGPALSHLRGKIVNGTLITEPADAVWTGVMTQVQLIKGMRLQLKLGAAESEGLVAGYPDVGQLWQDYSQAGAKFNGLWGGSGPSSFAELHRLADGFKDPHSGTCTALSFARKYYFMPAYVIHPSPQT